MLRFKNSFIKKIKNIKFFSEEADEIPKNFNPINYMNEEEVIELPKLFDEKGKMIPIPFDYLKNRMNVLDSELKWKHNSFYGEEYKNEKEEIKEKLKNINDLYKETFFSNLRYKPKTFITLNYIENEEEEEEEKHLKESIIKNSLEFIEKNQIELNDIKKELYFIINEKSGSFSEKKLLYLIKFSIENNFYNILDFNYIIKMIKNNLNKDIYNIILNNNELLQNIFYSKSQLEEILNLYFKEKNNYYLEFLRCNMRNMRSDLNKNINIIKILENMDFNNKIHNNLLLFHSIFKSNINYSLNYIDQFINYFEKITIELYLKNNKIKLISIKNILDNILIKNRNILKVYLIEIFLSENIYHDAIEKLILHIFLLENIEENNFRINLLIKEIELKYYFNKINDLKKLQKIYENLNLINQSNIIFSIKNNSSYFRNEMTENTELFLNNKKSIYYNKIEIFDFEKVLWYKKNSFNNYLEYDNLIDYIKLNTFEEKSEYYFNYFKYNTEEFDDQIKSLKNKGYDESNLYLNKKGINECYNLIDERFKREENNITKNKLIHQKKNFYKNIIKRNFCIINNINNHEKFKFDNIFFENLFKDCTNYKECIELLEDNIDKNNNNEYTKSILNTLLVINKKFFNKIDSIILFEYLFFKKNLTRENINDLKLSYFNKNMGKKNIEFNDFKIKYNLKFDFSFYNSLIKYLENNFKIDYFKCFMVNYLMNNSINDSIFTNTINLLKNKNHDIILIEFYYLSLNFKNNYKIENINKLINILIKFKNNEKNIEEIYFSYINNYNLKPKYLDIKFILNYLIYHEKDKEFQKLIEIFEINIENYYKNFYKKTNEKELDKNIFEINKLEVYSDLFIFSKKNNNLKICDYLLKTLEKIDLNYNKELVFNLIEMYPDKKNLTQRLFNNIKKLNNLDLNDYEKIMNLIEKNPIYLSNYLFEIHNKFFLNTKNNFDNNYLKKILKVIYLSNNINNLHYVIGILKKNLNHFDIDNENKNILLKLINNCEEIKLKNILLEKLNFYYNLKKKNVKVVNESVFEKYFSNLDQSTEDYSDVLFKNIDLKLDYNKKINILKNVFNKKKFHGKNLKLRAKIKDKTDNFEEFLKENGIKTAGEFTREEIEDLYYNDNISEVIEEAKSI